MKLLLEWDQGSLILEPDYAYILGRDTSSDIYINSARISRSHLKLSFEGKSWILEDLGSSNGTYNGKISIKKMIIKENLVLNLGGIDSYQIRLSILDNYLTGETPLADETRPSPINYRKASKLLDDTSRIRLRKRIRIGRHENNDWVIRDANVSRNHAEIIQNVGGLFEIIDLKSTNGTFLNGQSIKRESLKSGDVVRIGSVQKRFTLDGLEAIEGIQGTDISVNQVSFEIKGKKLLDKVSFHLGPRTLTAIIGPSGAGKSTLLSVINGRTKPMSGQILIGGSDLHLNFQANSQLIGSVPQSDILHTKLSVHDALTFGAKLRLPDDTSNVERMSQINLVLEKLELKERADLRIDKLSGGQRKRASIGLELLTSPDVLILDEPTSGLDPGLDAHVMETLRNLADEGQTVVVVTHSVDSLEICDNVILMASGGRVAYCGPASSVFSQLGKKNWAEVFRFLASEDAYNLAQEKFAQNASNKTSSTSRVFKRKNFLRQTATLSHRYFKVISSDIFYLTLLGLIPLIIGVIAHLAGNKYGFGKGYISEAGISINPFARGSILVLILGSVFVGLSTSIQEIIKENQIRIREQVVGIKPISYLISKMLVLGLIVLVQITVFVQIVLFGRPVPQDGLFVSSSRIEITMVCVLLAIASMILGLLISSLITSSEQAMPALVGMTMMQVVLSGSLPLGSGGFIDTISRFSPSYWATNALSSSIDLVQISRITDMTQQEKWSATTTNFKSCLEIILIFCSIFATSTFIRLRKVN